ncbi:hypothetical protein [Agrococcus carbonis]|uniref:Uncharacterized protein n=1 Tax=Agrococcus carbonis TaxID=684552 RepID=A0A1H1P7L0_9MICO|nr:hypothetical protein [Agrococcus carbonis]SDS06965.1 hypothetical protein SAMN04489719_1468 [Agrococcus carbonis]
MTAVARLLEPLTPRVAPADPVAFAAMQRDRQASSIAWLIAAVLAAQHTALAALAALPGTAGGAAWPWAAIAVLVSLAMLGAGAAQLVLLVRADRGRAPVAATIGTLAAFGALLAPLSGFLMIAAGMLHVLAPLGAMGFAIALLALDPRMRPGVRRPVGAVLVGAAGAVAMLLWGVIDALVLLPLTLAPGMALGEIYAALGAAREDGGVWVPLAWAGLWLLAIVLLSLGLLRSRRGGRAALGMLLAVPVVALLALPLAEFSIGMGVSDTVASQGGMSSGYPALVLIVTLLAATAAALLISARRGTTPS